MPSDRWPVVKKVSQLRDFRGPSPAAVEPSANRVSNRFHLGERTMSSKSNGRDRLGRRRHENQNRGACLPAPGDGGSNLRVPHYLGPHGKACWRQVRNAMKKSGLLDSADARALEMFAAAYEEFRVFRSDVMKNGATVITVSARGHEQARPNPALSGLRSARDTCIKLFACLGIGANHRASLGIAKTGG